MRRIFIGEANPWRMRCERHLSLHLRCSEKGVINMKRANEVDSMNRTVLFSIICITFAAAATLSAGEFAGIGSAPDTMHLPTSLTGNSLLSRFKYNMLIGTSYAYSTGIGGKGDMLSVALSKVNYTASESFALDVFGGVRYRPLMTQTTDIFGNPLEQGDFVGGFRATWLPQGTDDFVIELEYGYTDRDFHANFARSMYLAEHGTIEGYEQNTFNLHMFKRLGNIGAISVDVQYTVPPKTTEQQ